MCTQHEHLKSEISFFLHALFVPAQRQDNRTERCCIQFTSSEAGEGGNRKKVSDDKLKIFIALLLLLLSSQFFSMRQSRGVPATNLDVNTHATPYDTSFLIAEMPCGFLLSKYVLRRRRRTSWRIKDPITSWDRTWRHRICCGLIRRCKMLDSKHIKINCIRRMKGEQRSTEGRSIFRHIRRCGARIIETIFAWW